MPNDHSVTGAGRDALARAGWTVVAVAGPAVLVTAALAAAVALLPLSISAYFVPLAIVVAAAAGLVVIRACQGEDAALLVLLGGMVILLSLNFRYPDPEDAGVDLQNTIKLLAWLVALGVGFVRLVGNPAVLRQFPVACLLIFCLVAMVSATWSELPLYTFANALGLTAYLIFALALGQDCSPQRLIRALVVCLAIYMVINVGGILLLPNITLMAPSLLESSWRVQGLTSHPNVFGQQMVVVLLVLFIAFSRRALPVIWLSLLSLLALGLLIGSGSRTNLASLLGAVVIVLLRRRPVLLLASTALTIAAILAVLIAPADLVSDIFSSISRTGDKREIMTMTGRTDLWNFVVGKIMERPIQGYGYNGMQGILTRGFAAEDLGATIHSHSMYLQTAFGVGLLGTIPMFGLFFWLAARFITAPLLERDVFFWAVIINGVAEVGIFGMVPNMMALVFFCIVLSTFSPAKGTAP